MILLILQSQSWQARVYQRGAWGSFRYCPFSLRIAQYTFESQCAPFNARRIISRPLVMKFLTFLAILHKNCKTDIVMQSGKRIGMRANLAITSPTIKACCMPQVTHHLTIFSTSCKQLPFSVHYAINNYNTLYNTIMDIHSNLTHFHLNYSFSRYLAQSNSGIFLVNLFLIIYDCLKCGKLICLYQLINMEVTSNKNRERVKVSKDKAGIWKNKLKNFKQSIQKQQDKFQGSDEVQYYIVSVRYIEEWVEFCSSNEEIRYRPTPMNQDLMDQAGGELRHGLTEKVDFQIVNTAIMDLIFLDEGFTIKRKAYFEGHEKKVPVYLSQISYLKLESKDLKAIDYKRMSMSELILKKVKVSEGGPIIDMIEQIRTQEQIKKDYKIRLWKNGEDLTIKKLYDHIVEKCSPMSHSYRIAGLGKLIEKEEGKVSDLNIESGDFFIVESVDSYYDWFFKSLDEAKCEGCYKYRKLPFPCGCKKVAYCTEACQEKDKRYHLRDCAFAEEEEINKKVEMTMTSSSSLGLVGLSNLGNTCFMNSCLQCLSHTMPLTEYYLKSYYEAQINKNNPLGSRGKLAKAYAKFIKNMWCESDRTFSPYNLKNAVSSINPMFSGYAQHDSQQFFSFIVDGIHEDLNRIQKKPYVQSVESKGRKDAEVALESWVSHTKRNQSIIVDLLTGQYKSKVVCPDCHRQSITFDPFTTVSLPIPDENVPNFLKYFVIFSNCQQETKRMGFSYKKSDQKSWLETATNLLKRKPSDFAFYILTMYQQVYSFETTSKDQITNKIEEGKNIFLLELTPEERQVREKDRAELVVRLCKKTYYGEQYDNLWFKKPFFFDKNKITGLIAFKRILQFLYNDTYDKSKKRSSFYGKNYEQYLQKMLKDRPFTLVLKYNKKLEKSFHKIELNFGKQIKIEDTTDIGKILAELGPKDCELDARFTSDGYRDFSFERLKNYSDQLQRPSKKNTQSVTVTLDQCFNVFEAQEKLEAGNQWYCPQCKDHKLATKQITIYKSPQILILHLKRFKNKGLIRKEKNESNVIFPQILDMKNYLIDQKPMSSYNDALKAQDAYCNPSFKSQYGKGSSSCEYQLYAISNHYGGLGGGHYTAYCKNKGNWYQFNDSSVHQVTESQLKGSGAYMLFYKRKNSLMLL